MAESDTNTPKIDRFLAFAFGIASLIFFVLQANGVDINWELSALIYSGCAVAIVWTALRHAVPDRNPWARFGWAALGLVVVVCLGALGTSKAYQKEHNPSASDETLSLVQQLDDQHKFLEQYPMGYAIFDVDKLTGAVQPLQARQGPKSYILDFRKVAILKDDASGVEIQLPDVLKDGKTLLTGAKIGGSRLTMLMSGAGFLFSDGPSTEVMGIGRIFVDKGRQDYLDIRNAAGADAAAPA